jgi:hypothetical protein
MAPASRRTKQLRYDRAARKPLSRYGAVEGALARGLLRHAPTLQSTACTPNPGSLIMLQDPQGRR